MKNISIAALAAITLLSSALPAAADTGITLKAGGFVQTDSAAKSSGGNLAVGAEYELVHPTTVTPFGVSLYGDVLGKNSGVGLSVRTNTPVYAGAGVGLYHAATDFASASSTGGKIFAGAGIGHGAAIELGYHFLPQVAGVSTNAVSAQFALRF
ncbi:MAG TPA: hypothetical protein VFL13_00935 [Candidatus Baltobacteraceae bacterium]|nr:hypothetical protein [Candidatus Baltobacteraceae bacterium]